MIFPRRTALEAASTIEAVLAPITGKFAAAGDLRMEKSTLSRIEYIVEQCNHDRLIESLKQVGWRKLRAGRGPLVFACAGFPKLVICTAHKEPGDLLELNSPSNFEVLLFLRTGTQIFLREILVNIRNCGFQLQTDKGLVRGKALIAWTEAGIFAACGLPFIAPNERYNFRAQNYPKIHVPLPLPVTFANPAPELNLGLE